MDAQSEMKQFLKKEKVYGFFPEEKILASKRKSHFYADFRDIGSDAVLLDVASYHLIRFADLFGLNIDSFVGVPDGATMYGTETTKRLIKRNPERGSLIPRLRAVPKDRGGKKSYFVREPKGVVGLVEDVTTTGGSGLNALFSTMKVPAVDEVIFIALTNRCELTPIPGLDDEEVVRKFKKIYEATTGKRYTDAMPVQQAFEDAGARYLSLTNAKEMIPLAIEQLQPKPEIIEKINAEFKIYGIEEIVFDIH